MKLTGAVVLQQLKKWLMGLAIVTALFFLLNFLFPLRDTIAYSTIITDNKGEVLHAFLTADQQWRMKTALNEISPLLRKTIIAKEDKYFYQHPGINAIAMVRAFTVNLLHMKRSSGASTITMQVARAMEPRPRTYLSKCIEMFRALQLEYKYSKDEILQLYLNLVPYGGNLQGVKAASILYFGKNPDHLSLAEITALSIIPNRPSSLVIGKNNDLIIKERNRWLRKFAAEKVFTEKEIKDALEEPLTARRGQVPAYIPHLALLLKKRGGDIIHSTVDLHTQLTVENLVADYARSLSLKNIRNAAVVVMNNQTKQVLAYIGSANFYDTTDGGQVNGAAAIRQPGSTLKPLLYGLCIDQGLLTPKTVIADVAVNYQGYAPENYDKKFNGNVTMEYALEHSLNIPAVTSLRMLGKDKLVETLASCQFQQIKKDRQKLGLSLILGGCGASLEELTGLYSSFASDGVYTPPVYHLEDTVRKKWGVLSPAANFMINETLSKVNRPDFPLNWQSTEHMPKIAWKTGTSYGRRDAWSIGYNKHYTISVWTGNFSGQGIPELSGANIATPLLFKIFNTIDYDSDEDWFTQPADCGFRQVCAETGLLPNVFCTDLVTDYFIPLLSSAKQCDNTRELMVSPNEKISFCPACAPATGYKKKWYKMIAADMQAWMQDNGVAYAQVPPHNPACEKIFTEAGPAITSPANGTEYLISKSHPQPIQLSCRAAPDASKLYWYINNKFYKACNKAEKPFFVPDEGPVKISCTDDKGRNRDVWITVKYVQL
ncbi:MAG TPA: penicillin-binding protein 1C [Chitinophagaceae bacterium]|nr:penicillin-binding protein 1C [Chitinophagaceae bacterium]